MIKLSGEVDVVENVDVSENETEEPVVASQEPPEETAAKPEAKPVENEVEDKAEDEADDSATQHQRKIADANTELGEAALTWSRLQEDTKAAKKRFDAAVAELRHLASRGPEDLPLFDQPTSPLMPPIEPLERGQLRVRVRRIDAETLEVPPPPLRLAIICSRDDDGDVWWKKGDDAEIMLDASAGDSYEILEEYPVAAEMPIIHQPPLKFGPDVKSPPAAVGNDAWRTCPVTELGITAKQITKLDVGTIGELEDLRAAISQGKKKWPKGIGPAAVTKIEDAVLDWLGNNGPKPTE